MFAAAPQRGGSRDEGSVLAGMAAGGLLGGILGGDDDVDAACWRCCSRRRWRWCGRRSARAGGASVWLEELTWTELRERIAAGATTVLVPIGGTEQNGPHMVLGKHNVRVRVLAARIAEQLGNALVAPVLAYVPEGDIDPPTQHMRYAGTIIVPAPAFEAVLEGAARSLRRARLSRTSCCSATTAATAPAWSAWRAS